MNEILIIHIAVASVLLFASCLMKIWPPKKINYLYGYRTARSMKNQRNWDMANRYGADFMMWAGITTVLIQILTYLLIGGNLSLHIPLGYYIVFIIISIIIIERQLIKKGD